MIVYIDTSSLAKLYVRETETDAVRQLVTASTALASSIVTYAEVRAALARAHRMGRHTSEEHAEALAHFEREWVDVMKAAVDEPLVRRAGELAEEHGLRGFDAVHLASALRFQNSLQQAITFSAFDAQLTGAAVAIGLVLP